jgi:hypothetical protein
LFERSDAKKRMKDLEVGRSEVFGVVRGRFYLNHGCLHRFKPAELLSNPKELRRSFPGRYVYAAGVEQFNKRNA